MAAGLLETLTSQESSTIRAFSDFLSSTFLSPSGANEFDSLRGVGCLEIIDLLHSEHKTGREIGEHGEAFMVVYLW